MSAYVVNNRTINAIVKGFLTYDVDYYAENYEQPNQFIHSKQDVADAIGQSLLNQNYKSVNYRYREETPAPKYHYEDVEINTGIIYGCIKCYNYQASETDDYFQSYLYQSLQNLQEAMLERYIKNDGFAAPWGYEGHNILE